MPSHSLNSKSPWHPSPSALDEIKRLYENGEPINIMRARRYERNNGAKLSIHGPTLHKLAAIYGWKRQAAIRTGGVEKRRRKKPDDGFNSTYLSSIHCQKWPN